MSLKRYTVLWSDPTDLTVRFEGDVMAHDSNDAIRRFTQLFPTDHVHVAYRATTPAA